MSTIITNGTIWFQRRKGRCTKNSSLSSPAASTAASSSQATRLPAERQLAEHYGVARSVVRQALAGLTRDGLAAASHPLGCRVLGPRISWLPRVRPLTDEPWLLECIDTAQVTASDGDAATLHVAAGDPVVIRSFKLRGRHSGEPWAGGIATHPLDGLNNAAGKLLLSHDFIDDDTLEAVAQRRIIG